MFETLEFPPSLQATINRYRSISIFVLYFLIIAFLFLKCGLVLFTRWKPRNQKLPQQRSLYRVSLFAGLAVLSLITTWYFMISFLMQSYQDWILERPDLPSSCLSRLRGWLNETYLFEQAWAAIIETEARFWWTIQIFGFASLWSVFLGIEGLFHLAIVLHRTAHERF